MKIGFFAMIRSIVFIENLFVMDMRSARMIQVAWHCSATVNNSQQSKYIIKVTLIVDENPELCNVCPKTNEWLTYPRTVDTILSHKKGKLRAYSSAATFKCRHIATKRPICAIPCNGQPELCENDADEKCEGPGLIIVFMLTTISAIVIFATALVVRRFETSVHPITQQKETKDIGEHDTFLHFTLRYHKTTMDFMKAKSVAAYFYERHPKDEELMESLGTNELTAFFYDCVNESFSVRCLCVLQPWLQSFFSMWNEWNFHPLCEICLCIMNLSLRYSDLSKDLLLLYIMWLQLGNYEFGSFPMAVFSVLASSIVMSEIGNFVVTFMNDRLSKKMNPKKVFATLILTPLIPAFYMYKILLLKLKQLQIIRSYSEASILNEVTQSLLNTEEEINRIQLTSSQMHCWENLVEQFVQLTIVILITLLGNTSSRGVEKFDTLFVDGNSYMGAILVMMSLVSVVRGQIYFLKANKNGCTAGIFIIIPYVLIGISAT